MIRRNDLMIFGGLLLLVPLPGWGAGVVPDVGPWELLLMLVYAPLQFVTLGLVVSLVLAMAVILSSKKEKSKQRIGRFLLVVSALLLLPQLVFLPISLFQSFGYSGRPDFLLRSVFDAAHLILSAWIIAQLFRQKADEIPKWTLLPLVLLPVLVSFIR